jgi:hypothetical protein
MIFRVHIFYISGSPGNFRKKTDFYLAFLPKGSILIIGEPVPKSVILSQVVFPKSDILEKPQVSIIGLFGRKKYQ